jgi:hypothetical protein
MKVGNVSEQKQQEHGRIAIAAFTRTGMHAGKSVTLWPRVDMRIYSQYSR